MNPETMQISESLSENPSESMPLALDRLFIANPPTSSSDWAMTLLELEAAAKRDRLSIAPDRLMGSWRLYYVTIGKVNLRSKRRRGFRLPEWVPAMISFSENSTAQSDCNPDSIAFDSPLQVKNQITIAGIHLQFTGPARFQTKRNLLAFDFTQCQVSAFGIPVYSGTVPSPTQGKVFNEVSIGKLPFFAFFYASDRLIAARGRGGGLAIWVK